VKQGFARDFWGKGEGRKLSWRSSSAQWRKVEDGCGKSPRVCKVRALLPIVRRGLNRGFRSPRCRDGGIRGGFNKSNNRGNSDLLRHHLGNNRFSANNKPLSSASNSRRLGGQRRRVMTMLSNTRVKPHSLIQGIVK